MSAAWWVFIGIGCFLLLLPMLLKLLWVGKAMKVEVIVPPPPPPFAQERQRLVAGQITPVSFLLRVDQLFDARLAELDDDRLLTLDWVSTPLEPQTKAWWWEGDRLVLRDRAPKIGRSG